MKLLFIHDHPFYKDENGDVYSGGGLPAKVWENYFLYFDSVCVFGRLSANKKDKKIISSRSNVSFYLTEEYQSPKDFICNLSSIKRELSSKIIESDVVLVRLPSVLGLLGGIIGIKLKRWVWVEQVGNAREALSSHGSLLGKCSASFMELYNRKIVKKANFVSYVTKYKLQSVYRSNINAVTCSASNVYIDEILEVDELDESRFFDKIIKIGLIGGFDVRYKGQDVLLAAISNLSEDIQKNIELYFVGKGEYSWIIDYVNENKIKANIKFIGSLSAGDEIKKCLKELSLYVQPSLTEGMPRAMIEAMSMGCPVLGSDAGGIPDLLNSKLIHKKGDFKGLSVSILYFYNNRPNLVKVAKENILLAQQYSVENIRNTRIEFYEKMDKKIKNNEVI